MDTLEGTSLPEKAIDAFSELRGPLRNGEGPAQSLGAGRTIKHKTRQPLRTREMPGSTMFGYSLMSVLRARRRSILVIVGLALAVAIVAAPAIALDSEIHTLVDRLVASIPYDYVAQALSTEFDNGSAAAASVDGVLGAEPVVSSGAELTYAIGQGANGSPSNLTPVAIAFVRPSFSRFSDRFGLSGSFDLPATEIAITDRIAGRYGMRVGDTIGLLNVVTVCTSAASCSSRNVTADFTIGSILATPLASSAASHLGQPLGVSPGKEIVFASLDSLDAVRNQLGLPIANPPSLRIFVWADRSQIIDPYDPAATQSNVLHIEREVTAVLAQRDFAVAEGSNPDTGMRLSDVVRVVNDSTAFQRGILLLLSVPAAGLAFLFTRISFDTGLARRRHEIGTLRSRGSDVGMIVEGLLVETLLLGTVAAVVGFAISILVSRVFLGFVNASFPGGASIPLNQVTISLVAVLITVAAAILVAFLVSYPLIRRASNVRIVRALRITSPFETAVEYREARSFLMVALGLGALLLFMGLLGSSGQGGLLQFLFGAVLTVLVVLAPVLLIVGVARYVTLGTDRPYRSLARVVRPWLGELDFLVVEGLRRNPRRSSNLAVIVAFALAFAMFVVSLAGVVEAHEIRIARTAVGGDLFFDSGGVPQPYLANLSAQPTVQALALVDYIPSNYGILATINSTQFLQTVPGLDAYYFLEGDPSSVSSLIAKSGAIPNSAAARALGLHMGDPLVLNIAVGGGRAAHVYTVQVNVVAVVTSLPGLQRSGTSVDLTPIVVVDRQTLATSGLLDYPLSPPGERLIVRLKPGVDPHALAKSLEDQWSGTATVYEDLLASMRADPFRASLVGQLYTEAGLSVFVAVLAVSAVAYASGVEREGEFATVVSRGLPRGRLAVLLFGEGIAVGVIGALPAIPMVLVLLWALLKVSAILTPYTLPMEFLVPWSAWFLLAGTLGAVALGSLLAGIRLRWMNLPKLLKLRGM